mgnify:CR=1 FL=1
MIPILNNVLVKPYPSPEITESGFYVPENAREVNNKVLVVEVGKGTDKKPMLFKKGVTAFRVKDWGTEIVINNEKHFLMDQGALLAIE